jgi:hypothetical protein
MFLAIFHRLSDDSLARVFNARVALDVMPEQAAEWVFHATNAPTELLDSEQEWFVTSYRAAVDFARSVSVGDMVQVGEEFFRCEPNGWLKVAYLGSFDSSMDEDEQDDDERDQFLSDAEADADALASCGWGTDEDYGYYGDDY